MMHFFHVTYSELHCVCVFLCFFNNHDQANGALEKAGVQFCRGEWKDYRQQS